MPKVLVDKSKEIKERTYAIKTCPICGSVIEITEREAMNASINEDGAIQFQCPCGQNLNFYKYFNGKKYTEQEYVDCLKFFKQSVDSIIWTDLQNYMIGYGKYYFNLSNIQIIVKPIHIIIETYINRYEKGNWKNCLAENDFYMKYDLYLSKLSNKLDKCASYSQALADYIVFCLNKLSKQRGQNILREVNQDELISFLRNGDIKLTEEETFRLCNEKFDCLEMKDES